ncbi:MAG: ankyrin repeat domain-containing protein [Gammaproteobacteria bacterium]
MLPEQFDLWVKEGRLSKRDTKLAHPHKNQKTARILREFIKNRIEAFSYSVADRNAPPALIDMDLPLVLQQIAHMIAGDHQVPGFTPLNSSGSFTLDMHDRQSRDLFHFAIYHNHLEAIKLLIALGADANQWFSDGKSPLHLAAFNGQIDAIRTLVVPRGAYINIGNNKGITPLFLAAQNGHIPAIHTLLDLGANSNAQMHDNETPVFFAARFGCSDAIAILKKRGALIDARMNDDTSAIFFAAHNGHTDSVRTLMDLGADYRSPNRDGITPLEIAEKRGYPDIVRLLSKP